MNDTTDTQMPETLQSLAISKQVSGCFCESCSDLSFFSSTSGRNTCHTTFRSIKKVHTYTLVEIHTFPFRHGHKAESVIYLEVLQHMLFQRDWGRCSLIARLWRHVARTNMFLIYFKILILITVVKHYKFTCCYSQGKDHKLIAMQCSLQ